MKVETRPFTHKDARDVSKLGGTAVSTGQLRHAWVICVDEVVVGYTAVSPVPGLDGLYELVGTIAESHRRTGLGSRLLADYVAALADTAVARLSVAVPTLDNPTAHFLQKHNFHLEHTEHHLYLPLTTYQTNKPTIQQTNKPTNYQTNKLTIPQTHYHLPALYEKCFANTPWYQPYTTAEVEMSLTPTDECWLLLDDKNRELGFAWLHFPEDGIVEIEPIGIFESEQGKGYGRILLTKLLTNLKRRGETAVRLGVWQSNHRAISLYESVGFVKVGEMHYLELLVIE